MVIIYNLHWKIKTYYIMKKFIMMVIFGLTMTSLQLKAQYSDQGLILQGGWAMDWNSSNHGFDPSRADVAAYYCRGIGFVGPNIQFPSKSADSFRINLKGGININVPHVLFSPYVMASYTHYRTDLGLPEVSIGYGGMINICIFAPIGVYVDFCKAHYLSENYLPKKAGPMTLKVGFMVVIR